MTKGKRRALIIVSILTCVSLTAGSLVYFTFFHRYKGKKIVDEWHETDKFDINKITTLEKKKDKDFVILNLADVQIADLDKVKFKKEIHDEITYLVNTYKPDLITLTGDQTMSNENRLTIKSLVRWLDSYKIPYAPIFGNHDGGNDYNSGVISFEKACEIYSKGKYSLFKRGPTNLGSFGNYAINIKEDGKILKTLYMMDLGFNSDLTTEQQNWFKWTANGIKENNDNVYVESMLFTHKDLAHRNAYKYYLNHPESAEGDVYCTDGTNYPRNEEFVEVAKSLGVKDFVSGHLHGNNFTINYNGARYTFALKTGHAVYFYQDDTIDLNGGTEIRIGSDKTSFYHRLYKR